MSAVVNAVRPFALTPALSQRERELLCRLLRLLLRFVFAFPRDAVLLVEPAAEVRQAAALAAKGQRRTFVGIERPLANRAANNGHTTAEFRLCSLSGPRR